MTGPQREWVGTGTKQLVEPDVMLHRVPDYDPRTGEHLWTVLTMYRVVPGQWSDATHTPTLDRENLLSVVGPGCYYCEQPWTALLATRRCKGERQ